MNKDGDNNPVINTATEQLDNIGLAQMPSNYHLDPSSNIQGFIPNIEQYFTKIDDSQQYLALVTALEFVDEEIEKVKESYYQKEKQIASLKKDLKNIPANN